MENASKALLIAGAILVAVLIISIGLYIVSSVKTELVESEMSQVKIQVFNQEYLNYEGVQQGRRVKQLLIKAAIYNGEITGDSFSVNGGDFNMLSNYGFGIRGTAQDILEEAAKLSSDWSQQLKNEGNYKVGVAQPGNIRKIASWINPDRKYMISFSFKDTGRIREIIVDDIKY